MYRGTTPDVETSAPLLLRKLEVILIPKLSCLVIACWLDEVFKINYNVVVVVVVLLFYVHGKHLRSCRDGQLT